MKRALWIGQVAFAGLFAVALSRAEASEAPAASMPACAGHDLGEGLDIKQALARRADDLVNAHGLLWRIEQDGVAPSYLYGTMHSADADAIALAHEAAKMLAGAKVVATELRAPLGVVEKAELAGDMFASAIDRVDTIAGALAADSIQRIDTNLAARGFPHDFAHHLKLWFLAIMTSLPECETKRAQLELPVVDDFLAQAGKDGGLSNVGLETADEQIRALASLPADAAATVLAQNVQDPAQVDDGYVTMLRLYREERPAEILAIMDSVPGVTPAERSAQETFMEILLARNAAMAERAKPLLAAGGAFIAVGALHLPGKQGLIERWRAAGYTIVNVW
jgi:uncharacterized protein